LFRNVLRQDRPFLLQTFADFALTVVLFADKCFVMCECGTAVSKNIVTSKDHTAAADIPYYQVYYSLMYPQWLMGVLCCIVFL